MLQKTRDYRPLPDCLTVKKSPLHGLGIFAAKDIPAGRNLGLTHVNNENFEDGLIRTPLGGFMNYSSKPNAIFIEDGDTWYLETLVAVKKGQELTADYTSYNEDVLATFN